jgi:hypothetical protein
MRPSASALLRIKPIPASSLPAGAIGSGAIRLPPAQVPSAKAKGKARAQAEKSLSPIDRLQRMDQSSTRGSDGKGEEGSTQSGQAAADTLAGEGLPPNLRLEKHVSPKNRYWGVSAFRLLPAALFLDLLITYAFLHQVTRPERRILQRNVFREG